MTTQVNSGNSKRAIVVFDTRYGNTEKIARSLEAGLKKAGVKSDCVNAKQASLSLFKEYDLIALGAPTEWLTASKAMKEFLEKLWSTDFSKSYAFAFDTKLARPMSGSAAKFIEKELKRHGIRIIADRESATVFLENRSTTGASLKEGEEKRFEDIGRQLGMTLSEVAANKTMTAT